MKKKYYKVNEVVDIFAVSKSLIYELIAQGKIPVIKFGKKRYLISEETVEKLKVKGIK